MNSENSLKHFHVPKTTENALCSFFYTHAMTRVKCLIFEQLKHLHLVLLSLVCLFLRQSFTL